VCKHRKFCENTTNYETKLNYHACVSKQKYRNIRIYLMVVNGGRDEELETKHCSRSVECTFRTVKEIKKLRENYKFQK
jgi:hypothetical protein